VYEGTDSSLKAAFAGILPAGWLFALMGLLEFSKIAPEFPVVSKTKQPASSQYSDP
jgi:hypothetical protein